MTARPVLAGALVGLASLVGVAVVWGIAVTPYLFLPAVYLVYVGPLLTALLYWAALRCCGSSRPALAALALLGAGAVLTPLLPARLSTNESQLVLAVVLALLAAALVRRDRSVARSPLS